MEEIYICLAVIVIIILLVWIGRSSHLPKETVSVKPCVGCVNRNVIEEYGDRDKAAKLIHDIDVRVNKLFDHLRNNYGSELSDFNPDKKGVVDVIKKTDIYQDYKASISREMLQERINQLVDNYDSKNIHEIKPHNDEGATSFTENKSKLVLCLRQKDKKADLHDINIMMFVVLHELAHMMNDGWGHEKEFWNLFKFLLQNAVEANLYDPVDYGKNPVYYCGMKITHSPLFDR